MIGADPSRGVVDLRQRVYGYENLLVCDGSVVPANPGVNPSLTITALAEHAMTFVPAKTGSGVAAETGVGVASETVRARPLPPRRPLPPPRPQPPRPLRRRRIGRPGTQRYTPPASRPILGASRARAVALGIDRPKSKNEFRAEPSGASQIRKLI